jgi:hypothetical protein
LQRPWPLSSGIAVHPTSIWDAKTSMVQCNTIN